MTLQLVLALLGLFALVQGWRKGAVRQLGSLAAVVVAVVLSRLLAPAEPQLFNDFLPELLRGTAAGTYVSSTLMRILIFAVAFGCVMLLVRMTRLVLHAAMLGPVDRLCGVAISLFKWGLAASVALNLWLCVRPVDDDGLRTLPGGPVVEAVTAFAPAVWGEAGQLASTFFLNNDNNTTNGND